jgi:hypothetical protein
MELILMDEQPYTLSDDMSDRDIVTLVSGWVTESQPYHDAMLLRQNKMVQYYLGEQTDRAMIPQYDSNTVYNRLFEGTETLVPIVTAAAHAFIAVPAEESELSLRKARKVQTVLTKKYEDLEIQKDLECTTRDMILKRYGVLQWFWDKKRDDVNVRVVDPRTVYIPKLKCEPNDLPYVMELQEYTKGELETEFPGVDVSKLATGRKYLTTQRPVGATSDKYIYQVWAVSTDEYSCWVQGDIVLRKEPNPYYDFEGEEEERYERKKNRKGEDRVVKSKIRRFYNHLDRPKKNYVFFTMFTTGDGPVGEASLAEIALPIQDDINIQKRQITNNLVKMGNGQVYIDAEALPEEMIDSITSEPGLIIIGKNIVSENRIKREPGVPLPSGHFSNLMDSLAAFDNVFGLHAAIRGQSQKGTLGAQILNKQQDMTRVDQITRVLNRGVAELADGIIQLMKLNYTEEHVVKIIGRDGAIEFLRFMRNDIEDGLIINVKSGTPVVLDPQQRYQQAIQLWQLGGIDPETLFEKMDDPDPAMRAQKLAAWKAGTLILESQLRSQEAQTAASAKMSLENSIEQPANMMNRAAKDTGGAPKAPAKAPKMAGDRQVKSGE